MIRAEGTASRELKTERLDSDLVVIGGGLAGCCCAITAARAGLRVTLLQDRPVLGGNASSEVRLWILGATSHMGNNNRWAREGGVIDEILVENLYRNPEGNPCLVDALLLEKTAGEPNLRVLLNTAAYEVEQGPDGAIRRVVAFCSQNSTRYEAAAPLFCDASGDGVIGFLAGAAFRMGSEGRAEFGEAFAPEQPSADLLGHTIYFYSKDAGRPVKFVPPHFALMDITRIPRFRSFTAYDSGCRLWWLEWGGRLDTVHESERIKWELWKVVYGVWNHIKNSGQFPEAETLTLEWVGAIPGKRESRRFEGDYLLRQQDIIEQRPQPDAVSFGGWAIDLHPAEGVFSAQPGCSQWHSKGVYPIPYRCFYSQNIPNLFLAGRIVSVTHVAFGSTRVMATGAHGAQAAGMAAALCARHRLNPRDLGAGPRLEELRRELLRAGQFIPGLALDDPADLARQARLTASSRLRLAELGAGEEAVALTEPRAMMLPVKSGPMPGVTFLLDISETAILQAELRVSSRPGSHTPDTTLKTLQAPLAAGARQPVRLDFDTDIDQPCYVFVCLMANPAVSVRLSDQRLTGVLALVQKFNRAVAKSARQTPPPGSGIDSFEFWIPERRPGGKNFALVLDPPLEVFGTENLTNGVARPTIQPNAWVGALGEEKSTITLTWPGARLIGRLELTFDTDYDHPMESVLMGHPERVMPFCVPAFEVYERGGRLVYQCPENHQTRRTIRLDPPLSTDRLAITLTAPESGAPAALFEIRVYES